VGVCRREALTNDPVARRGVRSRRVVPTLTHHARGHRAVHPHRQSGE